MQKNDKAKCLMQKNDKAKCLMQKNYKALRRAKKGHRLPKAKLVLEKERRCQDLEGRLL